MLKFTAIRSMPVIAVILALSTIAGKKNKAPKSVDSDTPVEVSGDFNQTSMRVHAADMMYELDLSPEQMRAFKTAAAGAADDHQRNATKGNEKLLTASTNFDRAILAHEDDETIAKLRNALTEAVTNDQVQLDDEVHVTIAARSKAPALCRQLSVGQIAAYLASHADQLADPSDQMMSLLTELHDSNNTNEADLEIKQTSEEIGQLMAGEDRKKAIAVADQATAWIKSNRNLSEDEIITRRTALAASAKKMLGDVPPMDILGHWMENQVAALLANPQLPAAIDAAITAHENEH